MVSLGLLLELERILGNANLFASSYKKDAVQMEDIPPIDLVSKDSNGDTILHQLIIHHCSKNHISSYLSALYKLSGSQLKDIIDAKNNDQQTPLHISICEGMEEIVSILIEYGANPAVENGEGETAFYLATKLGKNGCLRTIAANADSSILDIRCHCGESPLHQAIKTENMEAFKLLLEKGVDVDLKNKRTGETPLHYAARKQNEEMLKSLLDRNADVRAQTTDGDTPLHFIRSADERSLALLLLEKGADIYVKNNAEESPHDLADKTYSKVIQGKDPCGTPVNCSSCHDDYCCRIGNCQLQRFLQRNRKDRKTRRKKGQTEATKAENSPQSNKEAQESGPGVGASTFVPFSAVLGTRPSKVPRQDSNQSDPRLGAGSGTKENGVTSRADNLFQPELFNSILSDLRTYEQNQTTVDFDAIAPSSPSSSQGFVNGSADQSSMLCLNQPTSTQSISFDINSPSVNVCEISPSELEQQVVNTHPMCPTTTDAPAQQSLLQMVLLPHTSSADLQTDSQPAHQTLSGTFATSASPLGMMTVQQTLPNTLPSSPAVVTVTNAQETPSSPSTYQNIFIPQTQQTLSNSPPIALQLLRQVLAANPSIFQQFQQASSNSMCVSPTALNHSVTISSPTSVSQSLNIDHALQSAGLVDAESRSLALSMPDFMNKVQDIANQLGLLPADVLHRLLSAKPS